MHDHAGVRRTGAIIVVVALLAALAVGLAPRAHASGCNPFPDVHASNVHCKNIAWAKAHGITKPAGKNFRPDVVVRRGPAAALLYRVATGGKALPTCSGKPFSDVKVGNAFCGAIAWAKAHHVTHGVSGHGKRYGPRRVVTRQSAATFLHRVSNLLGGSAEQTFYSMSLPQRVGELLMVGTPAGKASSGAIKTIGRDHVGSVILTGRSHAGVAHTKKVTRKLQAATGSAATGGTKLIIAADQEGGDVQVLQGHGFGAMPSALYQGTHYSLKSIRSHADTWGKQLQKAGVNLNLAPVMDTVSKSFAPHNAPIGHFDREFGYTAHEVGMRGTAFANGMRDAGMAVSLKHFPGLGRVKGNTDVTAGVTDTVTGRHSKSVGAFATGVDAGAKVVMVSTAMYSKIDPHTPAAFSPTVLRGMLRGDLGFDGVIISDSLDGAKQVAKWSPAARAVKFVEAGGDLILDTGPSIIRPMYSALIKRAKKKPAFAQRVNHAALHVLHLKKQVGLLH
jgi:beta-N-acetylhexosaminidase